MEWVRDWWERLLRLRLTDELLLPVPCLPLLWFFLAGSLPVTLVAFAFASTPTAVGLGAVGLLSGLWLLPRSRWCYVACLLLGAGLAGLHVWAPWASYRRLLPAEECFARVRGVMIDDRIAPVDTLQSVEPPTRLKLRLTQIAFGDATQPWQDCHGQVLLQVGDEENLAGLGYGSEITATGAFRLPWQTALPGPMNYRNYLKIGGTFHLYRASELTVVHAGAVGWRRLPAWFYGLRHGLAERLLEDVDNEGNRKMLAAMTVGLRQSMTAAEREQYLRSGMFHLFAISGLHVGVLFTILLLLSTILRLPFGLRHFLAPVVLLIYVLLTGAAPSAARAWLMLTVWSVGRGLKLPVVGTNTILVAALLLLLLNPFYIVHSGFQFSFVIVLCLIWGWRQGSRLLRFLQEHRLWVPMRAQRVNHPLTQLQLILAKSLLSMTAAWLGGIGLTASYNSLFLPTAVITNMVVCGVAWLVIVCSLLKLIAGLVLPVAVVAWPLHLSLSLLQLVSELSAEFGGARIIPAPSLALVLAWYAALLAWFGLGQTTGRIWRLGLVVGALLLWLTCGHYVLPRAPTVTGVVPSNSGVPVMVVRPPALDRRPLVINTGSAQYGYILTSWLRHQGIGEVEALVLLDSRVDYHGGAPAFVDAFDVGTLLLCSRDGRGVDAALDAQLFAGGRRRWYPGAADVVWQYLTVQRQYDAGGAAYRIEVADTSGWRLAIDLAVDRLTGTQIDLKETAADGTVRESQLTFAFADRDRVFALE